MGGKLVEHFSVCGWLHAAMGFIKYWATTVRQNWNDEADDVLKWMITETIIRVQKIQPCLSGVVCGQKGNEHVGGCKFPSCGGIIWSKQIG